MKAGTLTEFLLARIAEDAGIAESVSPPPWHAVDADEEIQIISLDFGEEVAKTDHLNVEHIAHWDPARVLAECEAKRRIIELHSGSHECSTYDHNGDIDNCTWIVDGDCSTLQLLGLPHADHPDYQQEWAQMRIVDT